MLPFHEGISNLEMMRTKGFKMWRGIIYLNKKYYHIQGPSAE